LVSWARTLLLHEFYSIGCRLSHSHIIALDMPAVTLPSSPPSVSFFLDVSIGRLCIYNTQLNLLLIPPQSSQLSLLQLGLVLLCFIMHILFPSRKLLIFIISSIVFCASTLLSLFSGLFFIFILSLFQDIHILQLLSLCHETTPSTAHEIR